MPKTCEELEILYEFLKQLILNLNNRFELFSWKTFQHLKYGEHNLTKLNDSNSEWTSTVRTSYTDMTGISWLELQSWNFSHFFPFIMKFRVTIHTDLLRVILKDMKQSCSWEPQKQSCSPSGPSWPSAASSAIPPPQVLSAHSHALTSPCKSQHFFSTLSQNLSTSHHNTPQIKLEKHFSSKTNDKRDKINTCLTWVLYVYMHLSLSKAIKNLVLR